MVKVPIWAYYCMNSCVTTRARSTRVLQYCHFDNFVLLTSSRLDGVTSPYPRENIIAGNYILADTQAFLSKRHRQQNKGILIKHSPGIGECFFVVRLAAHVSNGCESLIRPSSGKDTAKTKGVLFMTMTMINVRGI